MQGLLFCLRPGCHGQLAFLNHLCVPQQDAPLNYIYHRPRIRTGLSLSPGLITYTLLNQICSLSIDSLRSFICIGRRLHFHLPSPELRGHVSAGFNVTVSLFIRRLQLDYPVELCCPLPVGNLIKLRGETSKNSLTQFQPFVPAEEESGQRSG